MNIINNICPKQSEEQQKKIDRCCSLYYLMMGSIYNTVQSAMVDAREAVAATPMYRYETKRCIRQALRQYDVLDKKIKWVLGTKYQLWLDTTDRADEILQPHVFKLSMAINSYLLKHDVPNHRVIAKVETARILADMAHDTFERMFAYFRKILGFDLARMFAGGDFSDILAWWSRATKPLFDMPGMADINLNDDPNINLAVEILLMKMKDHTILNDAGNYALHRNRDVWTLLDEEDRRRLEAGQDIADPADEADERRRIELTKQLTSKYDCRHDKH